MSVGDERATGVGVGLVSLALMLAELVLTRIFSVTIWYHFAFVAIAIALFGAGLGGLVVHFARERLARADSDVLDRGCLHGKPRWGDRAVYQLAFAQVFHA